MHHAKAVAGFDKDALQRERLHAPDAAGPFQEVARGQFACRAFFVQIAVAERVEDADQTPGKVSDRGVLGRDNRLELIV